MPKENRGGGGHSYIELYMLAPFLYKIVSTVHTGDIWGEYPYIELYTSAPSLYGILSVEYTIGPTIQFHVRKELSYTILC